MTLQLDAFGQLLLSNGLFVTTIPSGTFTISQIDSGEAVAPFAAWFEISGVSGVSGLPSKTGHYEPFFHDITWIWDFDDGTPSVLSTLNIPTAWKDLNKAYGPRAVHVFQTSGTKTVRCSGYYSGVKVAEETISVTVADPDTEYTGSRTIIYDTTGTGDNTTYPSSIIVTSWSALATEIASRGASGDTCRILLPRGDNTDAKLDISDAQIATSPNLRFGAWGAGTDKAKLILTIAKAEADHTFLDWGVNATLGRKMDIVFEDIWFAGDWDSTVENGVLQKPFNIENAEAFLLVHDCKITGMVETTTVGSNQSGENLTTISNTDISDFADYGIRTLGNASEIDEDARIAIVGCNIAQNPDALDGGPKTGLHNSHGCPFRMNAQEKLVISASSFAPKGGWTGTLRTEQPALRLSQDGTTPGDRLYVLERIATEGGIAYADAGGNAVEPWNAVFDKVIMAATGSTTGLISAAYGGTTWRNTYGYIPAVPAYNTGQAMNTFFEFKTGTAAEADQQGGNEDEPINVYNNTLLNVRDDADEDFDLSFAAGSDFPDDLADAQLLYTDLDVENNVTHMPNITPAQTADGPLDITEASGFSLTLNGVAFNFYPAVHVLASNLADAASVLIPYSTFRDGDTTDSQDGSGGSATTQSYWNTNIGTRHRISIGGDEEGGGTVYYSGYTGITDEFDVAVEAGGIRITNQSGGQWDSGDYLRIQLDRESVIPAIDATYSTAGTSVPWPTLDTGSAALDDATTGLTAYDNIKGDVRDGTPNRGVV